MRTHGAQPADESSHAARAAIRSGRDVTVVEASPRVLVDVVAPDRSALLGCAERRLRGIGGPRGLEPDREPRVRGGHSRLGAGLVDHHTQSRRRWALRELRGAALELVGRRGVLARGRPELGSRHAERSLHHRDLGPFRRSRSELQVAHPRVLGRLTGRIDLVDRLDDLDLAAGDRGLHAGGSRAVSSGLPGLHLKHARGCLLRGRRRVSLRWARRPTASPSRSTTRPPPH